MQLNVFYNLIYEQYAQICILFENGFTEFENVPCNIYWKELINMLHFKTNIHL